MLTKLRLVFSITMVFLSFYVSAQSEYWERKTATDAEVVQNSKRFSVRKSQVFTFREKLFKQNLRSNSISKNGDGIVFFPNKQGKIVAYRVEEWSVLSDELSKKYPEIKSYRGSALNDRNEKIRFSVSHKDVQAMIVHADGQENSYVQKVSNNTYIMYSRDAETAKSDFVCRTKDKILNSTSSYTAKPVDGQVLRKYRLAISATAEYTSHHGGTIPDALAAINATVTRINQVFETDLAVKLELVADTDKVIYTNAATDPYSGRLGLLGSQGQAAFTEEIGEANYDIGHVLHKGENGGNAGFIGAICVNNKKGSAYSSGSIPEGDIFDFDFVAHEMGHQLGANHTWSYETEGTLVQIEPGSGTTIMGYAGITDVNDVTSNGDDYFHYISIEQIIENLRSKSCGEVISLTNNPPVVSAIDDYVIPKSTAFFLSGSATDIDIDDVLTYSWEQIDNGVVTQATFGPTNPSGANFRSRPPTTDPRRFFPMLPRVINGNLTQTLPARGSAWETVSDVERDFNFALTVRDNAAGGGQVVSELVNVAVVNSAGPFRVTSQAEGAIYSAGEVQQIQWDVAGTDMAPVNTDKVEILLSTDGGLTFPHLIADDVINDGSHDIIIPGLPTNEARIMVKADNNIYYAVNAQDFTIEASEIVMAFSNLEFEVCQFADLTVPYTYETYLGFSEEVTFSVINPPTDLGITFTPASVTSGNTMVDLIFENTENVPAGNYPIVVMATSASVSKRVALQLNVFDSDFAEVVMTSPLDTALDTSSNVPLEWENDASYTAYEVQIATDNAFANLVEVATVASNSYTPSDLQNQTTYFWRVKPINVCGEGVYNAPYSFTTVQVDCGSKQARAIPLEISSGAANTITSKITFFENLPIVDIDVTLDIDHSFLADLTVSLTSPSGTMVTLFSNSCGELQNVEATFDDDADTFVCGEDMATAITGQVRPLGSLSSFEGESTIGEWVLTIVDNAASDGGSLNTFSLDVCVEGEFRPDDDNDGIFDDGDDLCLGTPDGLEVNTSGCPIYRFPNDNFSVSTESESCRNNDDGALIIEANLALDYVVSINGNGLNLTETFTSVLSLPNLSSGTYAICIGASTPDFDYEQYCFEASVSQPDALGVTSKISDDGKKVVLTLQGGEMYTIRLNGEVLISDKSEITLNLKSGRNELIVFTDLSCQGIYEDSLFVSEHPLLFPNPFENLTKAYLSASENQLTIEIFNMGGQLVKNIKHFPSSKEVDLDFTNLQAGVYFVRFTGENVNETIKAIKR